MTDQLGAAKSRSPRRLALAVLLGLLLGLLLAPSAGAAPAWIAPVDLSAAGQDAFHPQIAVDPAGDAVAVWERSNGTYRIIEASTRAAGGGWLPPTQLSAGGQNAFSPQVAVDSAGDAVAVWSRSNGADYIVEAATRSAGGNWQAPVALSSIGHESIVARIAIDPAGDAVAAWDRRNGATWVIEAATKARGGAWQVAQEISATGQNAEEPQVEVAIDPAGNAVAVWERDNGANYIVEAATKANGGPWLPPTELSAAGQNAFGGDVAIDPAGNAVAVWERSNGTNQIVETATRAPGGPWLPPTELSAAGQNASGARVAVDQAGNAVAVWIRSNGANYIVEASTKATGGSWLPPTKLSAVGQDAFGAQVAVNPAGDAVAVWVRSDGTNPIVEAASKVPGGVWVLPASGVSAPGQNAESPQVAVDPAGDAVATWDRFNGTNTIVQTAAYDAAGPQLRSLTIPASGASGQRLAFTVSPFEVWSALGSTDWSFGDGGSAAEPSATHVFRKPGDYLVTVSASDALGNASSAAAHVAIWQVSTGPLALVRGGRARLKLRCHGTVRCQGVVRLSVAVKSRGQTNHRPASRRRSIGKARFGIAAGKAKVVPVPLSKKARKHVSQRGRRGLKAQIGGLGVKVRGVEIRSVSRHHRR